MPAPTTPGSDRECGQLQGHHSRTRLVVNIMRPPSTAHQSPRQSGHPCFRNFPEQIWHHLQNDGILATDLNANLHCRIENNRLSRTTARGLFKARLFSTSFFEVGAPTSNSDPDRSVRENPSSSRRTTGSAEQSYTKTHQHHKVILIFQRAQLN